MKRYREVGSLLELLNTVSWIKLGFEIGLALFVLISFVRCAME